MEHASQHAASLCASGEQPTNSPAAEPNRRKSSPPLQHQTWMTFIVTAPDTVYAIREKKQNDKQEIDENLSHKQTMCCTLDEIRIARQG